MPACIGQPTNTCVFPSCNHLFMFLICFLSSRLYFLFPRPQAVSARRRARLTRSSRVPTSSSRRRRTRSCSTTRRSCWQMETDGRRSWRETSRQMRRTDKCEALPSHRQQSDRCRHRIARLTTRRRTRSRHLYVLHTHSNALPSTAAANSHFTAKAQLHRLLTCTFDPPFSPLARSLRSTQSQLKIRFDSYTSRNVSIHFSVRDRVVNQIKGEFEIHELHEK